MTEEDPSTFHFGHAIAGGRLAMVDRVDQAHDVLHAGLKLYERIGSASALTQYHVAMGECHFRHGAWDDAIAEFEATDGLTREGLAWPILTHGTLGVIAAHRNDLRLAQHHVDTATAAFEAGVAPYRYDLVLQAKLIIDDARRAQGPQDSQALTREVWQWLTAGSPTVGFLGAAHEIAYRMVTSGDHAGAEDVAMRMRGCADANPDAPSILGSALLSEGVAHDDVASLIAAVDAYRRGRQPVAHAFACETAADALLDASRDEEAHRLLTEARDLYRQLQASVDITRVDNRIAAAGLGEPDDGSERRPVTGWEALTPTEERVARYLVQRLSNPEIAEAMYISRRTVESHVSHILTKLGVDSRREVARLHAAR